MKCDTAGGDKKCEQTNGIQREGNEASKQTSALQGKGWGMVIMQREAIKY